MRQKCEVAIVTGAGRGIGRAIAVAQAKVGAKVALLARTASEIDAVATTIFSEGGSARAYPVDLVDPDAVANAVAAVERELGPVDLLVNNAGSFIAVGQIWSQELSTAIGRLPWCSN